MGEMPAYRGRQGFRALQHALAGQNDRELVAAQAADDRVIFADLLQVISHKPQYGVAARVSERVVDLLELVQVEHQERRRGPVAGSYELVDALMQLAAIDEARQRIVLGEIAHPLRFALANRN